MELLCEYFKQRWRGIAVFAAFSCIFFISFSLYHLPLKAVLYPAFLCMALGVALLLADAGRIRKKRREICEIKRMEDILEERFPKPESPLEKEYQELIYLLNQTHREMKEMEERRFQDMVDYYTVWVHQIKTPIASMKLHLQNEDSALSRKLKADLHRIEQYVEMVLTFLRLNADSTDYLIREYDLDTIIRQAVRKFAGEFIERKISLKYDAQEVRVVTDEKWLTFVIEQVLSNALKYTREGSVTISVEENKHLKIRDTGIGIAPEDLPRIFENGYTGYNGRMDKKASGIGLYLCRRICRNLGHEISAKSIVGIGTIITIDLSQRKLEVQ